MIIFLTKFIFLFSPGDGGGAIGAALFVNNKYNLDFNENISPYLGNHYKDEDVLNILKQFNNKIDFIKFKNQDDLLTDAVEMLIGQKIIGWFQGRMEFGPRALGNRSILADPRNKEIKDLINIKIKKRENFRPFAPSILEEEKNFGTKITISIIIICLVLKKFDKIK